MKLVRTFHPVGHGAFYTERFYEDNNPEPIFTMVFDCGCFENMKPGTSAQFFKKQIKAVVRKSFKVGEVIDVLFISHFHTDHINGIDYLIHRCNVKKIFIPVITPEIIIEAWLHSFIQTRRRKNAVTIIIDKILHDEKIVNKTIQIDDDKEWTDEHITIGNAIGKQASGSLFSCPFPWFYIPFNVKQNYQQRLLQIEPQLHGAIDANGNVNFGKLAQIVASKKASEWKHVYKQIWGSQHNAYSMTVYSTNCQRIINPCRWNGAIFTNYLDLQNCLYTGDFEAKTKKYFKALKQCYQSFWPHIGIVQVPHHGSKDNYNAGLYDRPRACVISAGATDIYRHPSHSTIIGVQQNNCLPIVVTEDKYTCQTISYII